jgi:predicted SAM-dependent methyltransferase
MNASPLRRWLWRLNARRRAVIASRALARRRHIADRVLAGFTDPFKLHVGCGQVRFPGWVHLDGGDHYDDAPPEIVWNLGDGLPVPDGSCEFIYSEHVVEHLPVSIGLTYFRACHRALRPGGVVRTAMPSLDHILNLVQSGRWREQEWLTWPPFRGVATSAEMLNMIFRNWEHQWIYDREELKRRLCEAGFRAITFCENRHSGHAELAHRETRPDSLLIAEATRE